jgi:TPP-dependent pyruvate/acetoin dehydrogenase alpha subunit
MNKPTPAKPMADSATRLTLFRGMLRLRMIEETVASRYSDQEMRCPVHLSVGQEAAAVGSTAAMRRDDWIVSSHRGHAHFLAKGGDLTSMLAEIYGRETGCSQGRGGSMNLSDPRVGALLTLPIVASSIPIGVGVSLAEKQATASPASIWATRRPKKASSTKPPISPR